MYTYSGGRCANQNYHPQTLIPHMTYFWAFLAGVLTLINPCVLPLLPVIIAGALQSHRLGPVMMALGLTVSFTVVGVLVTAFGHLIGLDEILINRIAAIIMILFGIVLLLPRAQEKLSNLIAPLASGANAKIDSTESSGLGGQFFIGVLLGAVWSPCVGPTPVSYTHLRAHETLR